MFFCPPPVSVSVCLSASLSFCLSLTLSHSLYFVFIYISSFCLITLSRKMWYDHLLTWNATEEGVDRIVVPAENIWLPEIAMLNRSVLSSPSLLPCHKTLTCYLSHRLLSTPSVDEGGDLTIDVDFRINIESSGLVTWGPRFRWRTACSVDLTYFPFDRQTCHLQFINSIYNSELLNFTMSTKEVSMDSYSKNGEWDLVSAEPYISHLKAEATGDIRFPLVVLSLTLKRIPTYFVMNVVIPSVLITFLSMVVFWLPYESGEKVSLGITVLLSFFVVLLMISDVTPQNGNHLPILCEYAITLQTIVGVEMHDYRLSVSLRSLKHLLNKTFQSFVDPKSLRKLLVCIRYLLTTISAWYVVAAMNMTGISLVLTIFVLSICHHSPSKPIPVWLDKLVLQVLARLLCMHTHLSTRISPADSIIQPSDDDLEKNADNVRQPAWEKVEMIADDDRCSLLPPDVLKYLRSCMKKEKEKDRIETNREQWITLGKVIDRFFLVSWLVVLCLTTVITFPVLASNG